MTSENVCSIVIVNWKSIEFLIPCIESIKKNTQSKHEIIIIDNNSGSAEQTEISKIKNIITIFNPDNKGFATACNQGFQIAQGNYIFMLNPDTLLIGSTIDILIDYLENNTTIFAAAPKLVYGEDCSHHPSVKHFTSPFGHFFLMLPVVGKLWKKWRNISTNPNKPKIIDCVWGAAIMFRKEVFMKIGFFDERFFLYSEEVDLCRRMKMKGMRLAYHPQAVVAHYGGKSQEKSTTSKQNLFWTSKLQYFEKYYPSWQTTLAMQLLLILVKTKVILVKQNELKPIIPILQKFLEKDT
jgi:GT2 family glycosyltransferase